MCHLDVTRPNDVASSLMHHAPKNLLALLMTQLGARVGLAWVERLAELVANLLAAELVLIGEVLDDGLTVQTVALMRGGTRQPDAPFDRAGVLKESHLHHELHSESGELIGVFAVMEKHPRRLDASFVEGLELLMPRLAGELERVRAERSAARQRERLESRLVEREELLAVARATNILLITEEDLTTGEFRFEGDPHHFYGIAATTRCFEPAEWQALIPPSDFEALVQSFKEGMRSQGAFTSTFRVRHPDGKLRWILSRGQAVYDEAGVPKRIVYVNVDVTDQKTLENKLHHAQKLASIGELAAGLGHEVNTPLTIIQGCALQLKRAVEAGQVEVNEFCRKLELVASTTMRIANLVGRLKGFARLDEGEAETFDLVAALSETVQFFAPVYEQMGVDVVFASDVESVFVRGNRDRFTQLVMNLLSNARDAVLDCATRKVRVDVSSSASEVAIAVSDSGVGIPEKQLSRVFEPFYTTKPLGKGLGLGLSICESVVREMGGRFDVSSSKGIGTSFMVVLPKLHTKSA